MNSKREPGNQPTWQRNLETLRQALREMLADSGRSANELSVQLDRHPTYVGRLLRGKARFRVEEVFHLLSLLGQSPYEVLPRIFPLGDDVEREIRQSERWTEPQTRLGEMPTRNLQEGARRELGQATPSSVALSLRAGQQLRRLIRRRRQTQRAVARELGKSPRSLNNALTGRTELTFELAFQVLDVLDVSAGRYVLEILVEQDDLMDQIIWHKMLDFVEERRRRMVKTLAQELHDDKAAQEPQ